MSEKLKYQIALTMIDGVGAVTARLLVSHCGSAEAVFREKKSRLEKIPNIGPVTAKAIVSQKVLRAAQEEVLYIQQNNIQAFYFLEDSFPSRLKYCNDAPVMLYFKGSANLNAEKIIAVVGTRNATEYGLKTCEKIIDGLRDTNVTIVSGLAYGIDVAAHITSVKRNITTVGVLAHSLDRLYPPGHSDIAKKMMKNGGILSEYPSGTKPGPENFPERNRIVAGMSDCLLVVESGPSGGSLITANIALSYNKDVFAVPGRVGEIGSKGCHALIRENKAALVESAEDIIHMMSWDIKPKSNRKRSIQKKLFPELSEEEKMLTDLLQDKGPLPIDEICFQTGISNGKAASTLLRLELEGVVKSLPGKMFEIF